jgi:xanthine dehydrogenase accessory factor
MADWLTSLTESLSRGETIASVICVDVRGSAPCSAGSRMLVGRSRIWGTIGGGNLEFQAIKQARRLIEHADRRCLLQDLPLGPLLSQCCGGRVKLVFEKFLPEDRGFIEIAINNDGVIKTNCSPDNYGTWIIGRHGDLLASLTGEPLHDSVHMTKGFDGTFWYEPTAADARRVFIIGGGHIGQALAHILEPLRCNTIIVDRRDEVVRKLEPRFTVVRTEGFEDLVEHWLGEPLAVVLTHNHDLDYSWVRSVLKSGGSAYCGLIGSKTKRARFLRRLREDGLSSEQIEHLTCPIGLSGTKSKDPGAVALSTAAQLLSFLLPDVPRSPDADSRCATHKEQSIRENA